MTQNTNLLDFELQAKPEEVSKLIDKMKHILADFNPNIPDLEFRFEVAARELLANAIEHGCQSEEDVVAVTLELTPTMVELTVEDPGSGFAWEEAVLEEMPVFAEKGRGLAMVYQTADELEFNEQGNIVSCCFFSD